MFIRMRPYIVSCLHYTTNGHSPTFVISSSSSRLSGLLCCKSSKTGPNTDSSLTTILLNIHRINPPPNQHTPILRRGHVLGLHTSFIFYVTKMGSYRATSSSHHKLAIFFCTTGNCLFFGVLSPLLSSFPFYRSHLCYYIHNNLFYFNHLKSPGYHWMRFRHFHIVFWVPSFSWLLTLFLLTACSIFCASFPLDISLCEAIKCRGVPVSGYVCHRP